MNLYKRFQSTTTSLLLLSSSSSISSYCHSFYCLSFVIQRNINCNNNNRKQTPSHLGFVIATGTTTTTELNSKRSMTTLSQEDDIKKQDQCSSSTDVGKATTTTTTVWDSTNQNHVIEAKEKLQIWPLDEYNTILLNEVHPVNYNTSIQYHQEQKPHDLYDLIALGAGAGGLVSSKQSARRGAKSAMISAHLAGGDCLNVGCVPSKALLRAAKAIREVRRASEFGIRLSTPTNDTTDSPIQIDFPFIMSRMRQLRSKISPADGHVGTTSTGAHVYQGYGKFTSPNTIEVNDIELKFSKAVIATGGRPFVPTNIPGLKDAPYTTNEILFNLESLPPRMIILGSGIVALEMAQCFATFGSNVIVIQRSKQLFQSTYGDIEAAQLLQKEIEDSGVQFIQGTITNVVTVRERNMDDTTQHPLMSLLIKDHTDQIINLDCECLLVAAGRVPNVEKIGLEEANVQYEIGKGIIVNDHAQSISNPNVYAVGDCVADVPRLTHMSGEMAKLVVQNSLFHDDWKLSSLVVPAVMYTEPEYATVGISSLEMANKQGIEVDVYRAGLEHNDRAILESSNSGFCKILTRKGTDTIVGSVIVAERAGEMINEITLAMKNNIGLRAIGRNIHSYPTTGEAVMGCGIQYINANWERLTVN